MKTFKGILIISIHLVLLTSSCNDESSYYDYRLKVVNNSDKTIQMDFSKAYPDTAIRRVPYFYNNNGTAKPDESMTLVRGGSWENAFSEDINQKLIIFIFDANVVNNTPWDTIMKKYLILKRYDLTLEDLKSFNWTINYP